MKTIKVKELMVPLDSYAAVSEDATLYDAVVALRRADEGQHKHRSILVFDKDQRIVGFLAQWDVCSGLEPKYKAIGNLRETSRFGFSPDFLRSLVGTHGLWRKPLEQLCAKAADMKVRDIMVTPSEGEYIREDASLDEAIHLLVIGRHAALLVTRDQEIVGVLRLNDVFNEICQGIMSCKIEAQGQ